MAFFQMDKNEKKKPISEEEYRQYAKRIYNNAEEYFNLIILAAKESQGAALLTSANAVFANMAFACELYLKSMLVYEKCQLVKGHWLNELFEQLGDQEIKNTIKRKVNRTDFDLCIKEVSKCFEVIRYAYEYKEMVCDVKFLLIFMFSLHDVCSDIFEVQKT